MIGAVGENNLAPGRLNALNNVKFSIDKQSLFTFGVQHSRDVKILFCNVKGQVQIFQWVVLKKNDCVSKSFLAPLKTY